MKTTLRHLINGDDWIINKQQNPLLTDRAGMKDHIDNIGSQRPFVEESPSIEQLSELINKYGKFRHHRRTWDLSHLDEPFSPPSCSGEVVLIIRTDESKIVYVSRHGHPKDWFLPMGRIHVGESVEMAAIRETYEETGLTIDVLGIPLLYKVDIVFKDWTLRKWHFIVTGKPHSSNLQPIDEEEIDKSILLSEPTS